MARYKKKLPTSTVSAALAFRLSGEDEAAFWADVERHTGALDAEARSKLQAIIQAYIDGAQFEANAPGVDAARARLRAVSTTAFAFWQALLDGGDDNGAIKAGHYVEALIDQSLEKQLAKPRLD